MEKPIDLQLNYPLLPGQEEEFSAMLRSAMAEIDNLSALIPAGGRLSDKEIGAQWLSMEGYTVSPSSVWLGAGGHHGCLVSLLAAGLAGKTIVAEEFAYSNFKAIAGFLGIRLVGCAADALGLKPAALREICVQQKVDALYIMATINNPTGTVLPLDRRLEIVDIARAHDLVIIEDDAYGFLEEEPLPNFFRLAPERGFYIYSFSKPLLPGIKISYILAPSSFDVAMRRALDLTVTNIPVLYAQVLNTYISSGRLEELIRSKRQEGRRRQEKARALLRDQIVLGHVNGWHLWVRLGTSSLGLGAASGPGSALELAERLASVGVLVSAGDAYAVGPAPYAAIRIAMGGEREWARVEEGLRRVLRSL